LHAFVEDEDILPFVLFLGACLGMYLGVHPLVVVLGLVVLCVVAVVASR
jgi:hypothetical protein